MQHHHCPSCGSDQLKPFFSIKNAPAQSLITIKNYEEAMSIPTRDIDLTLCRNCGFVFNASFDTDYDYYTKGYEDQQGFSPTFLKWITGVTQRVIDKYDLRDKDIIEIGCGKGDFLKLICEMGNNRGLGIDPAFDSSRMPDNPNLRFIKEFYAVKHSSEPADFICCRHTLEHIFQTNEFISTVRKSIKDRKDVVVFMEVPEVTRILKVQAFWDIFSEHCSYFSPGALAKLFRKNYFEIEDLYLEYDRQYLMIEARPVDQISTKIHPLEESLEEMDRWTDHFSQEITKKLAGWRSKLGDFKRKNEKTVIWGGGSKSVGFLTNFNDIGLIDYVVDINPYMQGNFIPGIGKQYVGPDFLVDYKPEHVILMNPVYIEEVRAMLNSKGLNPDLIPL
jgi:SAM-dependent methyltransferase